MTAGWMTPEEALADPQNGSGTVIGVLRLPPATSPRSPNRT